MQVEFDGGNEDNNHQPAERDEASIRVCWYEIESTYTVAFFDDLYHNILQVAADCDENDDEASLYDLFPEVRPWVPITETETAD